MVTATKYLISMFPESGCTYDVGMCPLGCFIFGLFLCFWFVAQLQSHFLSFLTRGFVLLVWYVARTYCCRVKELGSVFQPSLALVCVHYLRL